MISFIRLLKGRYETLLGSISRGSEQYQSYTTSVDTLTLAEVAIKKASRTAESSPHNLVVLGPTQSGKSTLVNCLLPEPLAGVSSLAGFTTHPQGFVIGADDESDAGAFAADLFPGYQNIEHEDLTRDELMAYSLTRLTTPPEFLLNKQTILWDTPDFDSVSAHGYSEAVLRTVGLADVLILIVSKEKYADQSVWDTLSLIKRLRQPLIICLNKVGKGEEDVLCKSFQRRYKSRFPEDTAPPITALPFVNDSKQLNVSSLIREIETTFEGVESANNWQDAKGFVKDNWEHWLAPVYSELKADREWARLLESEVSKALDIYQKEYLDHPQFYETFQRTLAELLQLLEIPALAQPLTQVREVITWPARKLFSIGKSIIGQSNKTEMTRSDAEQSGTHEVQLLQQLADHLVTQLANASFDVYREESGQEPQWETQFRQKLFNSRSVLQNQFETLTRVYQEKFEAEIQRSACELYEKLEEQPAVLNSLRAARATTDAAAVVLALKSGGVSFNDFILAPAMLSLSSFLTESSLGQYLKTVKARLKARQLEAVRFLFTRHLQINLSRIRNAAVEDHKFLISEKEIREAVSALSSS